MDAARRDTVSDLDELQDMVDTTRRAVEDLVFTAVPSSLASVTQLLAAVPLDACEKLCAAAIALPPAAVGRAFSREDQLLIDMVLAMYDNRRTTAAHLPELAGVG